jgi:pyruvate/2-oxoglutarate dehydrogenase complex dihydrolipoamide dehydrogenase (E3) component
MIKEVISVPPMDQFNQTLVSNVHPGDWVNPEPAAKYNLVVIGAGTAGLVAASGAAGLGAKVALIEKHLMGGDCLNVGCVPSKCIIRSSRVAAEAREAGQYGVKISSGAEADFAAVMERMRRLRAEISHHDSVERFKSLGVDVFLGQAHFIGHDRVEVSGKILRFKRALIATGARAVTPPVEGLKEAGFLTNETIFSLTERPKHLTVFGAGPIGCEMAQAFRRLGSDVTIIQKGPQFLSREDPEAAQILYEAFKRDGVRIHLKTTVQKVTGSGKQKKIHIVTDGKSDVIEADEILVGAGRAPNVEGLNLEDAGVRYEKTGVIVNDYLQTTNPDIFAAGDICLTYKFTHTADATARIVIQNALFFKSKKLSSLIVPWCTYTDPEIAHVGMYEQEAVKRGIEVNTFNKPLKEVDRAIADGETEGFVKVHVKKGSDEILGATIVARHAGEMISEITLAMAAKVGLGTIAQVIHPYPTQAEAIKHVADAYNRTRLTPTLKKLFSTWLSWNR